MPIQNQNPHSTVANEIIQVQTQLASDRGNFEDQWQQVADRADPKSSTAFFAAGEQRSVGERRDERMLDSTAAIGAERWAAIISSLISPHGKKWSRLRTTSPELNKIPEVARWYDAANDILFRGRQNPRSGFYAQVMQAYHQIGLYGTGTIFTDMAAPSPMRPTPGIRYRQMHISETYFKMNHQGVIDECYRKFRLTHRQAKNMLDEGLFDQLPKGVEKLLSNPRTLQDGFAYIHATRPNPNGDPDRFDAQSRAFTSHYICVDTQEVVGQSGYYSFPFGVGRAPTGPGETYGRGPAMMVLSNIKVLNEQKRTMLRVGHRLADPVMLTHDDGVLDTFSARPGSITAGGLNSQGQKLIQALDMPNGQLPANEKMMDMEKATIGDAFLTNLFQILVETPRMTATEVLENMREKSVLMAPQIPGIRDPLVGNTIHRELDLYIRANLMPEMPQVLLEAEDEYEVFYDNPLSRLMRAEEASGYARWTEQALQISQITQDPSPLDYINFDVAMPELADISAVPKRWVATPDEVTAKRDDREQQANVQQAIDAAPGVADLIDAGAGAQ